MPSEINQTWVTLIPKVKNAIEVKDFRRISMVGCLYKPIAKILTTRLKIVMEDLVGPNHPLSVVDKSLTAH